MKYNFKYALATLLAYCFAMPAIANPPQTLSTKITWKDMRDTGVVKQNHDYSCGSSALATVLQNFYGIVTSEKDILDKITKGKTDEDFMASFFDLAKVSKQYGFVGKGITTNYDTLKKIKIPAIVYFQHRGNEHFSVVRAITEHSVYLADPSFGNRKLNRNQFEGMWHTMNNDEQQQGKVLLILPTTEQQKQQIHKSYVKAYDAQSLLKQSPLLFKDFL